MASHYWIKLYHEILDDAKMGRLRDTLWRRVVECFLMAGEAQANGHLPPLDDMAWRLRTNPEILESELSELADVGILEKRNGGWFVTNFAERQSAMSASERAKRWRERQRKQDYYAEETDEEPTPNENRTNRSQNKNRKEKDTETEENNKNGVGVVVRAYENEIGSLTALISDRIKDAVDEFGSEWVRDAIAIAAENNVRKWSYVDGILQRWRAQGRYSSRASPSVNGDKETAEQRVARLAQELEHELAE